MEEEYWYKEAIIYELHVKCFYDTSSNGIGDFKGLTQKLDYLQDLGITAIWLLPFYPSPLKDDGYDISDYTKIHPHYGTIGDFKRFLQEAHHRNIRVITELVLNHTSDQHPWFQRARNAKKNSRFRNYYVWSDTPDRYRDARIIFQDFESSNWAWDKIAESYYWHRFYSHQPDLNFDNPEVQQAIFKILNFWLQMGVDGLRLDAVPYLYQREGTSCENLFETHEFLKTLRAHVDSKFKNRMLLAEANQWPEDAAKYFGNGDECHMAFHFPVMPRLFMSIELEDSLPIIEIMGQTPEIPQGCQWAFFLRNHDELTLEMVTDEERDYMFRAYAHNPKARHNLGIRRRLAPLLKNDRRKIELMNALLFSLTGTPVIYYGDEIGMGDNIYLGDRNGVRTPMQWSNDRNAGFSKANAQQLYLPPIIDPEYHYETVNVEAQRNNPNSLLQWTKQLIDLRKRFKAFSYGTTEFLTIENRKVLVFFREYHDELIMIIANLSRFAQYVELELSKYNGYTLIEMFSGQKFPKIGELPYFLTLGPYGYFWFFVEKSSKESLLELFDREREKQYVEITIRKSAERIFEPKLRKTLENALRLYLLRRIWFKALGQSIEKVRITDHFALPHDLHKCHVIFAEITLGNTIVKLFPLYLLYFKSNEAISRLNAFPENVVIKFKHQKKTEEIDILYDATMDPLVSDVILEIINQRKKIKTEKGEIKGIFLPKTYESLPMLSLSTESKEIYREENSIIFPYEQGVLRLFWQIDEGMNVDVEMRLFLSQKTDFRQFSPIIGYVEYKGIEKTAVALAEEVSSYRKEFNSKNLAVEAADRFFVRMETNPHEIADAILLPQNSWMELVAKEIPQNLIEVLGQDLEIARLLAKTTANLHLALSSRQDNPDFSLVPFTLFYQRSLYQNIRRRISESFSILKKNTSVSLKKKIKDYQELEKKITTVIEALPHVKIHGQRMRFHGNYILENIHYTGKEFIIANFEGNPFYSYSEKRYKRSPLLDVVSMFLSFVEASHEAVEKTLARAGTKEKVIQNVEKWAMAWSVWMGCAFLRAYLQSVESVSFLPENTKEIEYLLIILILKKGSEGIIRGKIETSLKILQYWFPIYENFKFI